MLTAELSPSVVLQDLAGAVEIEQFANFFCNGSSRLLLEWRRVGELGDVALEVDDPLELAVGFVAHVDEIDAYALPNSLGFDRLPDWRFGRGTLHAANRTILDRFLNETLWHCRDHLLHTVQGDVSPRVLSLRMVFSEKFRELGQNHDAPTLPGFVGHFAVDELTAANVKTLPQAAFLNFAHSWDRIVRICSTNSLPKRKFLFILSTERYRHGDFTVPYLTMTKRLSLSLLSTFRVVQTTE